DLAMWLADFPAPLRVWAHMDRPRGTAGEESALVTLECESGVAFTFDISWAYVGYEERWWFETLSSRGSARLAPLRVVKELNGETTEVSPGGAAARESSFNQSYRAELAHFLSVVRDETPYEAPSDQVILHKVIEAAAQAARGGRGGECGGGLLGGGGLLLCAATAGQQSGERGNGEGEKGAPRISVPRSPVP